MASKPKAKAKPARRKAVPKRRDCDNPASARNITRAAALKKRYNGSTEDVILSNILDMREALGGLTADSKSAKNQRRDLVKGLEAQGNRVTALETKATMPTRKKAGYITGAIAAVTALIVAVDQALPTIKSFMQ